MIASQLTVCGILTTPIQGGIHYLKSEGNNTGTLHTDSAGEPSTPSNLPVFQALAISPQPFCAKAAVSEAGYFRSEASHSYMPDARETLRSLFPVAPYDIQLELAEAVLSSLRERTAILAQSPTGTGKSLAVLSAIWAWFQEIRSGGADSGGDGGNGRPLDSVGVSRGQRDQGPPFLPGESAEPFLRESGGSAIDSIPWLREILQKSQSSALDSALEDREAFLSWCQKLARQGDPGLVSVFKDTYLERTSRSAQRGPAREASGDFPDSTRGFSDIALSGEGEARQLAELQQLRPEGIPADELFLLQRPWQVRQRVRDVETSEAVAGRVVYAARTHSQIAQFAEELERFSVFSRSRDEKGESSSYASVPSARTPTGGAASAEALAFPAPPALSRQTSPKHSHVSCVTLASRQQYCIHPRRDMEDLGAIDDFCTDTRRGPGGCPYYKQPTNMLLAARLLCQTTPLGAAVDYGKDAGICPYYASRLAAQLADVVCLTHAQLLGELADGGGAMGSGGSGGPGGSGGLGGLGLLRGSRVSLVCDEAHGLPALFSESRSARVRQSDIETFETAFRAYLERYRALFSAQRLRDMEFFLSILRRVKRLLTEAQGHASPTAAEAQLSLPSEKSQAFRPSGLMYGAAVPVNTLLQHLNVDTAFILSFLRDMRENSTLQKMRGKDTPSRPLYAVLGLFQVLSRSEWAQTSVAVVYREPRELVVAYCPQEDKGAAGAGPAGILTPFLEGEQAGGLPRLRFGAAFVSGSLEPFSESQVVLFGHPDGMARTLALGHIIDASHLQVIVCSSLPGDTSQFSFTLSRRDRGTYSAIASLIGVVCSTRSCGGSVLFVPSYDALEALRGQLSASVFCREAGATKPGAASPFFIRSRKTEPRSLLYAFYEQPGQAAGVFASYRRCVEAGDPALLVAVAGGSLCEGIDFKDALCRLVIVLGVPYPNITDPVVRERDRRTGGAWSRDAAMKAVNQSVGRCIRHAGDWATILLLDSRYTGGHARAGLPGWVRDKPWENVARDADNAVVGLLDAFEERRLHPGGGDSGEGGQRPSRPLPLRLHSGSRSGRLQDPPGDTPEGELGYSPRVSPQRPQPPSGSVNH